MNPKVDAAKGLPLLVNFTNAASKLAHVTPDNTLASPLSIEHVHPGLCLGSHVNWRPLPGEVDVDAFRGVVTHVGRDVTLRWYPVDAAFRDDERYRTTRMARGLACHLVVPVEERLTYRQYHATLMRE